MLIDMFVSFRERPLDLESYLLTNGFGEGREAPASVYRAKFESAYQYFSSGLSAQGVWCLYNSEADADDLELWNTFAPGRPCAAAGILFAESGYNAYDELILYLTARSLRGQYDALVFDNFEFEFLGD